MHFIQCKHLSTFPVNLFYFFSSPVNYTKTVSQHGQLVLQLQEFYSWRSVQTSASFLISCCISVLLLLNSRLSTCWFNSQAIQGHQQQRTIKRIRTKQTQKNPLIKAPDNRRKVIINPNEIICLLVTTNNNNNIIIIIIIIIMLNISVSARFI